VPDVVFPTGIVETEDTFLVYYGAADTCTAVVEFSREELMATLIAL
jgi:beta-1,2-mannobiose phosphorylase / 1,2-beta-oligomannan phosphorylase